jgi:hypothetical protein
MNVILAIVAKLSTYLMYQIKIFVGYYFFVVGFELLLEILK